jgi:hypothetical protein
MTAPDRAAMEAELKDKCIPVLRALGFRGSFPDLYREQDGFVSLINFQFFSSGGSFCVNLSFADRDRRNVGIHKDVEVKKLRVSRARESVRLGAPELIGDHWFSFGPTSYGEIRGTARTPSEIAVELCEMLQRVAVPWWERRAAGG